MSNYIYEPSGRAREYAPLALHKKRKEFHIPQPRRINWINLRREVERKAAAGWTEKGPVLLSFMCDPYQQLELSARNTRRCIIILKRAGFNIIILTKAPGRAFNDVDLLDPCDKIGTTLTTLVRSAAESWEPGAEPPLAKFYHQGFYTWVSLEPLLDPRQARHIIKAAHFVNHFKVGMLHYGGTCLAIRDHAASFDWPAELSALLFTLQEHGYTRNEDPEAWGAKTFYLKQSVIKELEKCQQ